MFGAKSTGAMKVRQTAPIRGSKEPSEEAMRNKLS